MRYSVSKKKENIVSILKKKQQQILYNWHSVIPTDLGCLNSPWTWDQIYTNEKQ